MKINATLVKSDGLYGMVMPEKSDYTYGFGTYSEEVDWSEYDRALQSARDVAVRYDDQEYFNQILPIEIIGAQTKPGVYPLPEPLDCETIAQYCYLRYPNDRISPWFDGVPPSSAKGDLKESRIVLRILQGTETT